MRSISSVVRRARPGRSTTEGMRSASRGLAARKDGAEGTRLGVRMFVGHAAHIVPPVDKVYIAPNRHALQGYFEQTQAPGPPIGFRPTWDEAERALVANINTIEQEFYRSDRRRFGLGRLPRADDERRPRPAAGFGGRATLVAAPILPHPPATAVATATTANPSPSS